MAPGAQCAENGPFFSTTPRAVIQNGMAISQDILIMPDWLLIGLMMASFLLLMVILVIGLVSFVIAPSCYLEHQYLCITTKKDSVYVCLASNFWRCKGALYAWALCMLCLPMCSLCYASQCGSDKVFFHVNALRCKK